ncbi:MAG: hypothetical protein JEY97_14995, partial [Bacteroidales bacterium]|nr:hypothetical protein [Bacteroidales bacterium]
AKIFFGDIDNRIEGRDGEGLIFNTQTGQDFMFNNGNIVLQKEFEFIISTIKPAGTDGINVFNNDNEGITISNDKVLISTNQPSHKLEVNTNSQFNGDIKLSPENYLGTSEIFGITETGLKLTNQHNQGILIDDVGNVGIGTDNPTTKLDIVGLLKTTHLQIPESLPGDSSKSIAGSILQSTDNEGNVGWISQSLIDDGDWTKSQGNIYRNTGNVGIGGLSNLNTKLGVNGDIRVTGMVSIGTEYPEGYKFHVKDNDSEWAAMIENGHMEGKGLLIKATHPSYPQYPILQLMDQGSNVRFTVQQNGNICIGSSSPSAALDVRDESAINQKIANFQDDQGRKIFLVPRLGNGGYSSLSQSEDAGIFWADAESNNTAGFVIAPKDGDKSGIRINHDGNVGIGTPITEGYKLTVNGNILAKELKIIENVPESDYVFYDDYNLKPLSELENYIDKHNHLPEVPSTEEFKKNGYKVGEMDDLLLRKIEELTLYIIEQNKKIESLESEVDKLRGE